MIMIMMMMIIRLLVILEVSLTVLAWDPYALAGGDPNPQDQLKSDQFQCPQFISSLSLYSAKDRFSGIQYLSISCNTGEQQGYGILSQNGNSMDSISFLSSSEKGTDELVLCWSDDRGVESINGLGSSANRGICEIYGSNGENEVLNGVKVVYNSDGSLYKIGLSFGKHKEEEVLEQKPQEPSQSGASPDLIKNITSGKFPVSSEEILILTKKLKPLDWQQLQETIKQINEAATSAKLSDADVKFYVQLLAQNAITMQDLSAKLSSEQMAQIYSSFQ
jgi:hypothetical protein